MRRKIIFIFCVFLFLFVGVAILNRYCRAPRSTINFRSNSYVFKFRFNDHGFIEIPAIVKGKKYNLIIDTGSQRSLLQQYVPGTRNNRTSQITDSKGSVYAENNVIIDTMSLGSFDLIGHKFIQTYSKKPRNDGILGMDFLQYFTITLNFKKQEIELTRDNAVDNVHQLKKIQILGLKNTPCIELDVDGIKTIFLIDTGYDMFASVNSNTADKAMKKNLIHWQGYDESTTYRDEPGLPAIINYAQKIVDVCFTGYKLKREIIHFHSRKNLMHLVGLDFLKRFETVTFDFPNNTAYLGKMQKKSLLYFHESFRFNGSGILFNNDSLPKITHKAELVASKDIEIGDTIVGFENKLLVENIRSKTLQTIGSLYRHGGAGAHSEFTELMRRARFSGSDGQISILKNGVLRAITLKRQKLLQPEFEYIDYYPPMEILNIPYITSQRVLNDTSYYYIFKEIPGMR
ncbi:aspartyl protease family protein [Dyadobacter sp. 32]|uniref:aspartyl protease family protein n=1 Tax=Dyadobacter sp. 32 TaxID=538966 RepID=UPI0011EC7240